jgi:hypothetical protein
VLRPHNERPTFNRCRQALLLVQVTEAVVKALECYPVEILETGRHAGQRFVTLRAEPNNDRDRFAKHVGMSDSATALKRLFEEDRRDAEGKWRISLSPSLGATRSPALIGISEGATTMQSCLSPRNNRYRP